MMGAINGHVGYGITGGYGNIQPINKANINNSAQMQNENVTVPVQPVKPVREVISNEGQFSSEELMKQYDSDPASMAARMRIQYKGNEQSLVGENTIEGKAKTAQEVMEDGECQACANRKYKDGSDDPGVSFKSATHLSPEQAATAVRSHEMEHVTRNQAKAQREDREVVSQSVTIHTDICPECGDVYTSGGTTRTVTKGSNENDGSAGGSGDKHPLFSAIA